MQSIFFRIRLLLPYLFSMVLVLLSSLPVGITGLEAFRPMVVVMLIFDTTIYRPYFLGYWFLFFLGMLLDVATGQPLGLSSLILIVLRALLLSVRGKYVRVSFHIVWVQFILWLTLVSTGEWIILSMYYERLLPLGFAFMQFLMSILAYPIFHQSFLWVSRHTPRAVGEDKVIMPMM